METTQPVNDREHELVMGSSFEERSSLSYGQRTAGSLHSPSISLIQSAMRSLLDEATPSSVVSDDHSDVHGTTNTHRRNSTAIPSSLESLRMERPPPIPPEQDRKCFVGCLATVLAFSYEYDIVTENERESNLASKDSFSYGEALEDELMHTTPERSGGTANKTISDEPRGVEEGSTVEEWNGPQKGALHESSSVGDENSELLPQMEKSDLSATHRRRRYEVFCRFLITSSELLLLDESVSKAFLPLLSDLLVPRNEGSFSNRPIHDVGNMVSALGNRDGATKTSEEIYSPALSGWAHSVGHSKVGPTPQKPMDLEKMLRPFLESMSQGSGFRCISLFLLQHLLTSDVGYDARIRYAVKRVAVIILSFEMHQDPMETELVQRSSWTDSNAEIVRLATRKFEAIEQGIARRIIRLSESSQEKNTNSNVSIDVSTRKKQSFTRESILRGVKIGSAGIVAGTLFALSGGLAAPGIAAGVAAVTGSAAAATAALVTLTSTAVVTTIFGVGGGSLAAYKMQRRTQGLTEFEFNRESVNRTSSMPESLRDARPDAELFTTICVSGWLRDSYDFQRPWGIHPSKPRLQDPLELLQRFYSVFKPDYIANCPKILGRWKGEEKQLWRVLREKYGRDPDHLFPLDDGPRFDGNLTIEQQETLDMLFVELGYNSVAPSKEMSQCDEGIVESEARTSSPGDGRDKSSKGGTKSALPLARWQRSTIKHSKQKRLSDQTRSTLKSQSTDSTQAQQFEAPRHLETVWDYSATYAGELYTVRWESTLLKNICESVMDLAMDLVTGATRHILKQTVLSTLLAAVVWPSYLLNAANMIDGDWTLAVERADEAGKELANTLLLSKAGQRPVTLLGYSFGARVVYSCLKELSRLQGEWEEYRKERENEKGRTAVQQHRFAELERRFSGMREPHSIVEDAVIMGLPNHLSPNSWRACRRVVAGRLVNCFSTKDLILSLMFQAKRFSPGVQSILKPVCGTCPVKEAGVENVDISDLVQGHQDYCLVLRKILQRVRLGEPILAPREASLLTPENPVLAEPPVRTRLDF